MKNIILFLILIYGASNFAQSLELQETDSDLLFGINIIPNCSSVWYNSDREIDDFVRLHNEIEKPYFGYSFGISAILYSDKKVSFNLGLTLSNYNTITRIDTFNYPDEIPIERYNSLISINNKKYLESPILIVFNFNKVIGVKYFVSTGLIPSLFYSSKIEYKIEYPNRNEQGSYYFKVNSLKFWNIYGSISGGIIFDTMNKLSVGIEPEVRYSLISFPYSKSSDNVSVIRSHPYSFGLGLSLYFKM